jgi:hypothetical protein
MFLKPKKISPHYIAPNFIIGCGRIIDIGASLNKIPVTNNSDLEYIAHDWKIVGNDLYNSISAFKDQNNI